LDLIDDQAFVDWWLEQRATFRPKGKRALALELRQKGIDKELIERALAEKVDEEELARQAAKTKLRIWSKLPLDVQKEKLVGFLGRRGFTWPILKKILDEVFKKG